MLSEERIMMEPSQCALTLIRGGHVFAPSDLGVRDVLVGGNKILAILDPRPLIAFEEIVTVIDATDKLIIPGFIDLHCHVTGGGGELGPESRCPEATLHELIDSGITTVVGILGTDGISRSLSNLLTKVRSLQRQGLSAYMYTGAYQYPPPTLCDSVRHDIMHIEQCIGVGEIAISDSRSSCPTTHELARLALDARVAGMLSGKAGIVHVHVGKGESGIQPLVDVIELNPELPRTVFHPTHVSNRTINLLYDAISWCKEGGTMDFTADDESSDHTENALLRVDANDPLLLEHAVTVSTDAYGSFPVLGPSGEVVAYGVGKPTSLLDTFRQMIQNHDWSIAKTLPPITSTPAHILKLAHKGKIAIGFDADIIVLAKTSLMVEYVFASGRIVKTPSWTKHGMFNL